MPLFNGTVTAPPADTNKPYLTSAVQAAHNQIRLVFSEPTPSNQLDASEVKVVKGAAVYDNNNGVAVAADAGTEENDYIVTLNLGSAPNYGIYDDSGASQVLTVLIPRGAVADAAGNVNDDIFSYCNHDS